MIPKETRTLVEPMLWGLRHPLRVFLWTLLALFAVRPLVEDTPLLFAADTLFLALTVAALHTLVPSRGFFGATIVLLLLTAASRVGGDISALRALSGASSILSAALVGVLMACLLAFVLRARRVTRDVILSSITAYVLLGVFWGFVFQILNEFTHDAFALDAALGNAESQLRYFAMMTLTTVGYGDIVPRSSEARALAMIEALLGQLYLAAVVARLVGLQVAATPSDAESAA
jgi:Ion channel